jgi:SAM-dependent methyltransferase
MSNPPEFPKLDSATPEFWEVRYRADFTPWDAGGVPRQVQAFVEQQLRSLGQSSLLRVLVPGCGRGYEIACFAQAGWDVLGVDFSAAALQRAQQRLGARAHLAVQGDFFALQPAPAYEAMYERTFLCALKPAQRSGYARQMARLLRPGGLLFGYFYYDDKTGGPPFAITPAELEALLAPDFERIEARPVDDSLPIFAGKERWEVWRRRAHAPGG